MAKGGFEPPTQGFSGLKEIQTLLFNQRFTSACHLPPPGKSGLVNIDHADREHSFCTYSDRQNKAAALPFWRAGQDESEHWVEAILID